MFSETVSYNMAFIAGILSFFSPCVLPLIPAYFTFITGFSLEELIGDKNTEIRKKVMFSTIAYVLGFSFVFILMGSSATFLGTCIAKHTKHLKIVGGILIIILGIHLTGLIRIRFLEFEKKIQVPKKPLHFFGTFLVGMAFGAGWSPCIGPLLGSILLIAGSQETVWQGVVLLSIYSAGLAIPFIIISIFINFMINFIKKTNKIMKYFNLGAGMLLVLMGLFLLSKKPIF